MKLLVKTLDWWSYLTEYLLSPPEYMQLQLLSSNYTEHGLLRHTLLDLLQANRQLDH